MDDPVVLLLGLIALLLTAILIVLFELAYRPNLVAVIMSRVGTIEDDVKAIRRHMDGQDVKRGGMSLQDIDEGGD